MDRGVLPRLGILDEEPLPCDTLRAHLLPGPTRSHLLNLFY